MGARGRVRNVWLLAAAATMVLVACVDKRKAAYDELEHRGLVGIEVEPGDGASGAFTFTGSKGGLPCTGTVSVEASFGGSKPLVDVVMTCSEPEEAEPPREDPLAAPTAKCDAGDLAACTALGIALVETAPGSRDLERARVVHAKACDGGAMPSCNALGSLLLKGLGGDREPARAMELFARSCAAEDMDGCALQAKVHYIDNQLKEARELFGKACDGGSLAGCDGLGLMLKRGMGGPADIAKARDLFEAACQGGEMDACVNLGVMYLKGDGVPRTAARARELLRPACEAHVTVACEHLKQVPAE